MATTVNYSTQNNRIAVWPSCAHELIANEDIRLPVRTCGWTRLVAPGYAQRARKLHTSVGIWPKRQTLCLYTERARPIAKMAIHLLEPICGYLATASNAFVEPVSAITCVSAAHLQKAGQ